MSPPDTTPSRAGSLPQKSSTACQMTQRKPSPADSVKLAIEIFPGGQHDYPTSLLAD
ncbi:hypothetical protein EMIT0215P_120209 [Pseudomonas serboccidentalis]